MRKKNQTKAVVSLIRTTLNITNYKICKDLGFSRSTIARWGITVESAQYNTVIQIIQFYELHLNEEFQVNFWKLMLKK